MNTYFGDDFEDVSLVRPSKVWLHYLSSKVQNCAKCKYCGKLFKRDKKGSTTNLKSHLKSRHRDIFDQTMLETTKHEPLRSNFIGHPELDDNDDHDQLGLN